MSSQDRYILWLQQSLNKVLNARLQETGDLETKTRNALSTFRRRQRLRPTGDLICPNTEQALVKAGADPPPGMDLKLSETSPAALTLYVDIPLQIRLGKAKSRTGIFIPDGFCPVPQVDLIVFLHGNKVRKHKPDFSIDEFWKLPQFLLREEVNKSGRNVILVAPTLGPVNQPGSLTCAGGFDKFLNEVLAALTQHGPYKGTQITPSLGNIILACHSGSSWVMRTIAHGADAAAKKIQECWAFEPHTMSNTNRWKLWARSGSQTRLFMYYIGGRAGEQFCKTLLRRKFLRPTQVTCAQNIFAEKTSADHHDSVPATHLKDRIQGAPFLVTKSSCASARRSFVPRTRARTLQSEVLPARRTFVRDFSGPAGECDAGLARAGKTRAEALAIINQQIRIGIALLRNASASLTGTRTSKTKEIFRKIFRVNPEFVPTWLKVTPTIKDRGDVVAVRCKRVADLLASGTIRFFCSVNTTNCPDCSNHQNRFACSSWGSHRVICLGNDFWDAMKAGNNTSMLSALIHEPFHIFYGRYVTAHVEARGKFGGVNCILQFVFERNNRTPPTRVSDGCTAMVVRSEIGEFVPQWDQSGHSVSFGRKF